MLQAPASAFFLGLSAQCFLLDDLHFPGRGIFCHHRKLVLAADHVGRLRNISGEMDRVELAASRAQAAADAAVEINYCSAASEASAPS